MILTSTTASVPFTPAWLRDRPNPPKFMLRAGSVIERGMLEAEVAGPHRAGRVYGYELRQAFREGVTTLLADDPEMDRLLELEAQEADALIAAAEAGTEAASPLAEDDRQLLAQARAVLEQHWPAYRDLQAQMARRQEIVPILALRQFCTGWDGCEVPFARGRDGLVTEAALSGIDFLSLRAAGNEAYKMLYGEGQAGNSAQP